MKTYPYMWFHGWIDKQHKRWQFWPRKIIVLGCFIHQQIPHHIMRQTLKEEALTQIYLSSGTWSPMNFVFSKLDPEILKCWSSGSAVQTLSQTVKKDEYAKSQTVDINIHFVILLLWIVDRKLTALPVSWTKTVSIEHIWLIFETETSSLPVLWGLMEVAMCLGAKRQSWK